MNRRHFLSTATTALVAAHRPTGLAAEAPVRTWSSGPKRVAMLELFTSEGCSSCPPADDWFSKLKEDDRLWSEIVPLAFHVDYWDYLGWKDPYSQKAHTERQRAYSSLWRSRTIYTPGFVLNGREWRRSRSASPPLPRATDAPNLTAERSSNQTFSLHVSNRPTETAPLIFNLALLGMSVTTKVPRGENAGRELHHDFVVLAHQRAVADSTAAEVTLQHERAQAIAAWVSRPNDPTPLQATGGWLS